MTHETLLIVAGLEKHFTLHLHGAKRLPVVENVGFTLHAGECVVLGGPSGAGKSSILKMVYGNYLTNGGSVLIRHKGEMIELTDASPRAVLEVRRETLGYVSQFLRVIPRVSALDIVAEPARSAGLTMEAARARAASLLARLNLPERLWGLPPATFSGGEQQRVNIARGFAGEHAVMILDEPTASLDATNRAAVVKLIEEKKAQGCGFLGIFHDEDVRSLVADRIVDVTGFKPSVQGEAA
ncbi:MAG: phosphonate C-P lyase system protein PhnL [Proteobacteria bacterium]|nr:phosphonate C-P lyase system protein PhnL [Pseudomonadota bacterium]